MTIEELYSRIERLDESDGEMWYNFTCIDYLEGALCGITAHRRNPQSPLGKLTGWSLFAMILILGQLTE